MKRKHLSKFERAYDRAERRRRFEIRRIMGRAVRWAHKLGFRKDPNEIPW